MEIVCEPPAGRSEVPWLAAVASMPSAYLASSVIGVPNGGKMSASANPLSPVILGATLALVMGTTPVLAKECYAPDARSQERAFSRAVVTEGGKTVWLGGQTGSPNLDFEGQAREAFSELDKSIKAIGGSGLKDMVTMTVFIGDVRLGDRLTEIRKEIFKECFPGSALITVSGFARPGILIEIQGIAVIGGK
jgi:enamine deaminase RidA (YjgF/YER057c/UK114 family)